MILHYDSATDSIITLEGPQLTNGIDTLSRIELEVLATVALSGLAQIHGFEFAAGMLNRRHDSMRAKAAKEAAK